MRTYNRSPSLAVALSASVFLIAAMPAHSTGTAAAQSPVGETTRVSVSSSGGQSDDTSGIMSISPDGRYVAFKSDATNLVSGDTNGFPDIFVHDRTTGLTKRVSIDSNGIQGNDEPHEPVISADGRYVVFSTPANNLVLGDTNGVFDVFVHDCQTGTTQLVSKNSLGTQGNADSAQASISAGGRYVVFGSKSTNLVTGDTNGANDIFVHDRDPDGNGIFDDTDGITERVSINSIGVQANSFSVKCEISGDGTYVAFDSIASNLVAGDTNDNADIFVHNRTTGSTVRVSLSSSGSQAFGFSTWPSISGDGRYVAFRSTAADLVAGDTNAADDTFVHDRDPDGNGIFDESNGITELVSKDSSGVFGNGLTEVPRISPDGRYVSFPSFSTNLVAGDTNNARDIFVHDRTTGITERVNVDSNGAEAIGMGSSFPRISEHGRFVAFRSSATNLVLGDTNGTQDIFVRDRMTGWIDQGCALAGVSGDPLLQGTGTLTAGSLNSADLSNAAPSALAGLFVAVSSTPVPFKGGTLKPFPFFDPVILNTSPAGQIPVPFAMPLGLPVGTEIWVQWAIQDAAAVQGVALSNAIKGVTP